MPKTQTVFWQHPKNPRCGLFNYTIFAAERSGASLHRGAVGLDADLLDAAVAVEGGAGAAEARVLDAHAIALRGPRPRLLQRGPQGAPRHRGDGGHRGAAAVGRQRRVARDDRRHAAVGVTARVRLAARVRHGDAATVGPLLEPGVVERGGVVTTRVTGRHGRVAAQPPGEDDVVQRHDEQQEVQGDQDDLHVERLAATDAEPAARAVRLHREQARRDNGQDGCDECEDELGDDSHAVLEQHAVFGGHHGELQHGQEAEKGEQDHAEHRHQPGGPYRPVWLEPRHISSTPLPLVLQLPAHRPRAEVASLRGESSIIVEVAPEGKSYGRGPDGEADEAEAGHPRGVEGGALGSAGSALGGGLGLGAGHGIARSRARGARSPSAGTQPGHLQCDSIQVCVDDGGESKSAAVIHSARTGDYTHSHTHAHTRARHLKCPPRPLGKGMMERRKANTVPLLQPGTLGCKITTHSLTLAGALAAGPAGSAPSADRTTPTSRSSRLGRNNNKCQARAGRTARPSPGRLRPSSGPRVAAAGTGGSRGSSPSFIQPDRGRGPAARCGWRGSPWTRSRAAGRRAGGRWDGRQVGAASR